MKPLELTWYEQDETGDYIHPARYVISSIDVDYWTECKRLTDAELAAEWHANESEAWQMAGRTGEHFNSRRALLLEDRDFILRRFAKLPHYDEAV